MNHLTFTSVATGYTAVSSSSGFKKLDCIAHLSNKHGLGPYELLSSIVEAETEGTATCGLLRIQLRMKTIHYAIFLITKESRVIGQVRISGAWEDPTKTHTFSRLIGRARLSKRRSNGLVPIEELQEGMRNVSFRGKVIAKSDLVSNSCQDTGRSAPRCLAVLADDSALIRSLLWNGDTISVRDEVEVKNAAIVMFQRSLHAIPVRKRSEASTVEPNLHNDDSSYRKH